jgi:carbon monoxide dehydrogenase subunit G
MEMMGERVVPAPTDRVWQALNDPVAIKSCIAGCESIEPSGDNAFRVILAAKVGPISARFSGTMRMADMEAPRACTLRFEGTGGAAGFVRGEARVTLSPRDRSATTLSYVANAQVGGKLAQIGSRLIDGAAHKLTDDFFAEFVEMFSVPMTTERPAAPPVQTRRRRWILVTALLVAGLVALYLVLGR